MSMPENNRRTRGIRAVRSKNTEPEMRVRQMLHAKGYRYRLHKTDLPESPDLAFPSRKKVIFVNEMLLAWVFLQEGR